jgi:hypothetical protein
MSASAFIAFERRPELEIGKKTHVWAVKTKGEGGGTLGRVAWYAPWRKYCFYPESSTVFDVACLNYIADFCEVCTKAHNKIERQSE